MPIADNPDVTLEDRLNSLEVQIARLLETPGTLAWPNVPTVAQGFLGHRWQRRDGDGYSQALREIPEAPSDGNYYGRHDFGWSPVLAIEGGTMEGPLIATSGTGLTSVGLAIGDPATGFYRVSNTMAIVAAGELAAQFLGGPREAMFIYKLNAATNPISNVGDPIGPADALNLRTADARYLPMSERRAPSVTYDIPADVAVLGDDAWHQIATVPFTLTRTGNSTLLVSVSCNLTGFSNIALVGVRFASGSPERHTFAYGAPPAATGFLVEMTASVVGGPEPILISIELVSLSIGGTPSPFTVVGGAVATRSQITIIDLGPSGGSEIAEETEPSGAGRRERRAARPHYRRPA